MIGIIQSTMCLIMYPTDQLFVTTANSNDADKKNEFILILNSFTPLDMNLQMILMPKVILAKKIRKKLVR